MVGASETNFWAERKKETNSLRLASLPQPMRLPFPPLDAAFSQQSLKRIHVEGHPHQISAPLKKLLNSISLAHGLIQEVYAEGKVKHPPVVLVQDVHLNEEAQKNIAALLQELINQRQVGVVGVEGAFNPFDFSPFRSFPDKEITRNVTQDFLKKNLLAAPSYVGITSPVEIPLFVGVDDPVHYQKNVEAYLTSRDQKPMIVKNLELMDLQLLETKRKVFSEKTLEFDALSSAHNKNEIGLGSYVTKLQEWGGHVDKDSNLQIFLEAYKLESSLDFKQIEKERRSVMERLSHSINQNETTELIKNSLAVRLGHLSFGDFYGQFKDLCEQKKIPLRSAPAFASYIHYVLLCDSIKPSVLFSEIKILEQEILQHVALTPLEKRVWELGTRLYLTKKLADFSLTPEEWEDYRRLQIRPQSEIPENIKDLVSSLEKIDIHPFESFYKEADLRSRSIVKNLLSQPVGTEVSRVLVTGGFHTAEISKILRKENISHLVVSPKITVIEEDNGSAYLSIFSQEKTPLDRLFEGQKLFLASAHTAIGSRPNPLSKMALLSGSLLRSIISFETWRYPKSFRRGKLRFSFHSSNEKTESGIIFDKTRVIRATTHPFTMSLMATVYIVLLNLFSPFNPVHNGNESALIYSDKVLVAFFFLLHVLVLKWAGLHGKKSSSTPIDKHLIRRLLFLAAFIFIPALIPGRIGIISGATNYLLWNILYIYRNTLQTSLLGVWFSKKEKKEADDDSHPQKKLNYIESLSPYFFPLFPLALAGRVQEEWIGADFEKLINKHPLSRPLRILIVCSKNYYRSRALEAVLRTIIKRLKADNKIIIQSAGTDSAYIQRRTKSGYVSDPQLKKELKKKGVALVEERRPISEKMIKAHDIVLAVDKSILIELMKNFPFDRWKMVWLQMLSDGEELSDPGMIKNAKSDNKNQTISTLVEQTIKIVKEKIFPIIQIRLENQNNIEIVESNNPIKGTSWLQKIAYGVTLGFWVPAPVFRSKEKSIQSLPSGQGVMLWLKTLIIKDSSQSKISDRYDQWGAPLLETILTNALAHIALLLLPTLDAMVHQMFFTGLIGLFLMLGHSPQLVPKGDQEEAERNRVTAGWITRIASIGGFMMAWFPLNPSQTLIVNGLLWLVVHVVLNAYYKNRDTVETYPDPNSSENPYASPSSASGSLDDSDNDVVIAELAKGPSPSNLQWGFIARLCLLVFSIVHFWSTPFSFVLSYPIVPILLLLIFVDLIRRTRNSRPPPLQAVSTRAIWELLTTISSGDLPTIEAAFTTIFEALRLSAPWALIAIFKQSLIHPGLDILIVIGLLIVANTVVFLFEHPQMNLKQFGRLLLLITVYPAGIILYPILGFGALAPVVGMMVWHFIHDRKALSTLNKPRDIPLSRSSGIARIAAFAVLMMEFVTTYLLAKLQMPDLTEDSSFIGSPAWIQGDSALAFLTSALLAHTLLNKPNGPRSVWFIWIGLMGATISTIFINPSLGSFIRPALAGGLLILAWQALKTRSATFWFFSTTLLFFVLRESIGWILWIPIFIIVLISLCLHFFMKSEEPSKFVRWSFWGVMISLLIVSFSETALKINRLRKDLWIQTQNPISIPAHENSKMINEIPRIAGRSLAKKLLVDGWNMRWVMAKTRIEDYLSKPSPQSYDAWKEAFDFLRNSPGFEGRSWLEMQLFHRGLQFQGKEKRYALLALILDGRTFRLFPGEFDRHLLEHITGSVREGNVTFRDWADLKLIADNIQGGDLREKAREILGKVIPVDSHTTNIDKQQGAAWLANMGGALLNKTPGDLLPIKSMKIGDLDLPQFDTEAALLAKLEEWLADPDFKTLLIQQLKEKTAGHKVSAQELVETADLLTALVWAKGPAQTADITSATTSGSTLFYFTGTPEINDGINITKIQMALCLLKTGDGKTTFLVDDRLREPLQQAIRDLKGNNLMRGEVTIEYTQRPWTVDSLLERGATRYIVPPSLLKGRITDPRFISIDKYFPITSLLLKQLNQFLRAVLTAA